MPGRRNHELSARSAASGRRVAGAGNRDPPGRCRPAIAGDTPRAITRATPLIGRQQGHPGQEYHEAEAISRPGLEAAEIMHQQRRASTRRPRHRPLTKRQPAGAALPGGKRPRAADYCATEPPSSRPWRQPFSAGAGDRYCLHPGTAGGIDWKSPPLLIQRDNDGGSRAGEPLLLAFMQAHDRQDRDSRFVTNRVAGAVSFSRLIATFKRARAISAASICLRQVSRSTGPARRFSESAAGFFCRRAPPLFISAEPLLQDGAAAEN